MMSRPPNSCTALATIRSAKPSAVTLPAQATARPPASSMAATVSLAGASSRSLTTTAAPSEASLSAISRPMPRPEPVTSATRPSSFPIEELLVCLESDDSVAGQGGGAVGQSDDQLQGGPAFAVEFVDRDDLRRAGRRAVHRSDRG